MEISGCQQKLAHELGVISRVVYKHCSAHRSTKYFQALKKVDRHMHEFSRLGIFNVMDKCHSDDVECVKRRAVAILQEVEGNSMEVVERCLPELTLGHFVRFHALVIATISNLVTQLQALKFMIQKSMKSGGAAAKKPSVSNCSVQESESNSVFGGKGSNAATDLGTPISRSYLRTLNQKNKSAEPALKKTHTDTQHKTLLLDNNPHQRVSESKKCISLKTNEPHIKIADSLQSSTPERTPLSTRSQPLISSDVIMNPICPPEGPILTAMRNDAITNANKSCKMAVYIDHQCQPRDTNMTGVRKRTRKAKICNRRNIPLRIKRYHLRFLTRCYQKYMVSAR